MPDEYGNNQFAITSAGGLALEAIDYPKQGYVAALFEHSFYIKIISKWACIGPSSLPLGPLNLRTNAPNNINWGASGFQIDDPVKISATYIQIRNRYAFSYLDAEPWQPEPIINLNKTTTQAGLTTFTTQACDMAPAEGLASFIFSDNRSDATLPTAAQAIIEIREFLRDQDISSKSILKPVTSLIGLGPGLTPSGDDFLGGIMIMLSLLKQDDKINRLAGAIEIAASATNDISRAHLKAAAQGLGAEPLHATIGDITSNRGRELQVSLKRLNAIGHCSGWDALAGAVITLRAWLAQ
jgi:hypothetical protein